MPGIGNKSAQKLVLELKDKAGLLALGDAEPVEAVSAGAANELWREQGSVNVVSAKFLAIIPLSP